jgi:hypothetical protein
MIDLKQWSIFGGTIALGLAQPLVSNASHSVQLKSNSTHVTQSDVIISQSKSLQDRERAPQASSPGSFSEHIPHGTNRIARSYSVQKTSFGLERKDLRDPYTLTVRPLGGATQLKGTIKLNGRPLKVLGKGGSKLNLSPYLRKGVQRLEIVGSYRPASASVEIAIEGPAAETIQEMGGNGIINQVIQIDVD